MINMAIFAANTHYIQNSQFGNVDFSFEETESYVFSNCTFSPSDSYLSGGLIATSNCLFENCKNGAIYSTGSLFISKTDFFLCSIQLSNHGIVTLVNKKSGAHLLEDLEPITISLVNFNQCQSQRDSSCALYLDYSGEIYILKSSFNYLSGSGLSPIYALTNGLTVENSMFYSNVNPSTLDGGSIHYESQSSNYFNIYSCSFSKTNGNKGGAIYADSAARAYSLFNNTFSEITCINSVVYLVGESNCMLYLQELGSEQNIFNSTSSVRKPELIYFSGIEVDISESPAISTTSESNNSDLFEGINSESISVNRISSPSISFIPTPISTSSSPTSVITSSSSEITEEPSTIENNQNNQTRKSGLSPGYIALIIISSIIAFVAILLGIFFVVKLKNQSGFTGFDGTKTSLKGGSLYNPRISAVPRHSSDFEMTYF